MNKLNIKEFKAKAEERDKLALKVAKLEEYLETTITDLFIRNKGKYLIIKDRCSILHELLPPYIKYKGSYTYFGQLNYVEDLPRGYDASGIPDTLITEIKQDNKKYNFIITSTYNSEDLEYGMYIYTRYIGKAYFNENSYEIDRLICKIDYTDESILDDIFIFDTEEEALLFMEMQ